MPADSPKIIHALFQCIDHRCGNAVTHIGMKPNGLALREHLRRNGYAPRSRKV